MDFNDEKFTFTWNIENLICLRSPTEQKVSTSFRVSFLEDTDWELRLLFKSDPISKVNVLLCRLNDGPETLQIDLGLNFSDSNGLSNFEVQKKAVTFGKGKCFQSKPKQLYKNNFINETLVLKCVLMKSYGKNNDSRNKLLSLSKPYALTDAAFNKMYKDSCKQLEDTMELGNVYPNSCSAVTRFQIEQRSVICHLKHFHAASYVTSIPFISTSDLPALMLTLQSKKDSDEVEVCVHIAEEDIEDFVFVKCKICALSDTQNLHHILEDTNIFKPKEETVWKTVSFLKSSVLENLQKNVLSLRIELTIYDGESTTEVRKVLELADLHGDNRLKTAAQIYVKSKFSEILSSNEWRDLISNNAQLASETLVYISTSMLKS
ncbi:hypothetical protein JTE90_019587 [Oedothorax gibbosus]|uniref:MATH domain-containing protein n=1 Tax=Oedothorax gibbosus TaxID=931172 RepID=A0AAV6V719_9ARAC|nr:hypothetical protein JTE90_019587 [Oedothorax gibbosus]